MIGILEGLEVMCQAFWNHRRVVGEPSWIEYARKDPDGATVVRDKMGHALQEYADLAKKRRMDQAKVPPEIKNDSLSVLGSDMLHLVLALQATQINLNAAIVEVTELNSEQTRNISRIRIQAAKDRVLGENS